MSTICDNCDRVTELEGEINDKDLLIINLISGGYEFFFRSEAPNTRYMEVFQNGEWKYNSGNYAHEIDVVNDIIRWLEAK
jgi:hypothetical protein